MSETETDHPAVIAERFGEVSLSTARFVDVRDGEKACLDHDSRFDEPQTVPRTNFGIYADADDALLILDIDDHDGGESDADAIGLSAVHGLEETLTALSPHGGEHRFYRLEDGTPAEAFEERIGTQNPVPSWGEVQVANKYVVGAGSQLDGCKKDWCDSCAEPDGGYYTVSNDAPIASLTVDQIVRVLTADADLSLNESSRTIEEETSEEVQPPSPAYGEWVDRERAEGLLDHIDPDCDYPEWRSIGYALIDALGKSVGKTVFENWSRSGSSWDDDTPRLVEDITNGSNSNKRATVKTLVHYAKKGGWEPRGSAGIDVDEDQVREDAAKEAWEAWSDLRTDSNSGKVDGSSYIPELALYHIAAERELYDVDALPKEVDELPAKAHNRALYWVKERWPDDGGPDLNDGEEVTARRHKPRTSTIYTWEDVRYIYDDNTEDGRFAAVKLLRDRHDFLTPEDTEELLVYNEDIGIFEPGGRFEETDDGYRTSVDGRYNLGRLLDIELQEYYSQHERREIDDRLRQETADREELEAGGRSRALICVENGVLDVHTRELEDHDPEFKFTRRLPVSYDASAESPEIETFLDDITKSEEDALALLETLGNAFLPNYKHPKVLVLFGEGSNGKSTWLNVVRELLGAENTTSLTLQQLAENRFATARLLGKWANIAEDLPARRLTHTGTLKDLSGGGMVPAEKKGKDGFDFENRAKLMFAANRPPVLGERSYAIMRRLVPIHLPYRFTDDPDDEHFDKDTELLEKLTTDEELNGLLNLALDGLDRLEEEGDVSLSSTFEERLELYERHSDHIKAFRVDCLTNESGERVRKAAVYNAYTNYCNDRGHEPVKRNVFFQQLRRTTLDVTEVRPAANDRGERPRMLDNVKFTDEGKVYSPAFEAPTEASGARGRGGDRSHPEPIAIGEIDHSSQDRATVIGRVEFGRWDGRDSSEKGPAWKATLSDTTGSAKLVAWDESLIPDLYDDHGAFEPKALLVKSAKVDEPYDEEHHVELYIDENTEIEEAQPGAGRTESDDPGENEQIGTAADGGEAVQTKEKVARKLGEYQTDETVTASKFAGELDEDPSSVEQALASIADQKASPIERRGDGKYRVI